MQKAALAALALILSGQAACAASATGAAALALGALAAEHDWALSAFKRHTLAKVFAGQNPPYPAAQTIVVKAATIVCRESDVAINRRSCAITNFGHTVALTGRAAHELFATLIEVGVPADGAAGSIFESLSALECKISPHVIAGNSGAGAD
jgi:hypothetical protein